MSTGSASPVTWIKKWLLKQRVCDDDDDDDDNDIDACVGG